VPVRIMVPSNRHRACRCARDMQDKDGTLCCVDYGACDAGSREESAGAAAAVRVLCAAFVVSVLACAERLTRAVGNAG
jgi:hypothetical protein